MTELRSASRSDIGLVRANNEDAVVATTDLVAVADGLGGHPSGEVASGLALALVEAAFGGQSLDELRAGVRAANRGIWERAASDPELEGMGTTICVVGLIESGQLALVNVGDSRAYLLHGGSLTQLSQDHSVTADLIRSGELSEENAPEHPHFGVLTRALGVGPAVELDSSVVPAVPGDRLLVCSDGLVNELTREEIAEELMRAEDPRSAADSLVELSLARGGRDNISVVVADIAA